MNKKKTFFRFFAFYDRTNLKRFLEEKSLQGWLLCGVGLGYEFRQVEPRKRQFCIVYLPKAKDGEHPWEYLDYCHHAGWQLLVANQQMHVFCSELDNPTPIETDPVMEVENIHKSAKKSHIPIFCIELIIGLRYVIDFFLRWSDGDLRYTLERRAYQVSFAVGFLTLAFSIMELVIYFCWYYKAKLSAEQGKFTPTPNNTGVRTVFLLLILLGALGLLLVI